MLAETPENLLIFTLFARYIIILEAKSPKTLLVRVALGAVRNIIFHKSWLPDEADSIAKDQDKRADEVEAVSKKYSEEIVRPKMLGIFN